MITKELKAAADQVEKLQSQLNKMRRELEDARERLAADPMNDTHAAAIMTKQIKIEALQSALNQALNNQMQAEQNAAQAQDKAQLKHLDELQKKAERDKAAAFNAIDALKKDLERMKAEAAEHNKLTNKYQNKPGYIRGHEYRLLWQLLADLEKLEKGRRLIESLTQPIPAPIIPKLTQLQRDVMAMRYRDPNQTEVNVKLVSNDDGTGKPVYKVSK